jgi:hypothetical protein
LPTGPLGLTWDYIIFVCRQLRVVGVDANLVAEYYSYNVEAMVVMFWAFELAQSVYGLSSKPHLRPLLRKINSWSKALAVLFPMVTILLLRVPAVQEIFVLFILLADLPRGCLALSSETAANLA